MSRLIPSPSFPTKVSLILTGYSFTRSSFDIVPFSFAFNTIRHFLKYFCPPISDSRKSSLLPLPPFTPKLSEWALSSVPALLTLCIISIRSWDWASIYESWESWIHFYLPNMAGGYCSVILWTHQFCYELFLGRQVGIILRLAFGYVVRCHENVTRRLAPGVFPCEFFNNLLNLS